MPLHSRVLLLVLVAALAGPYAHADIGAHDDRMLLIVGDVTHSAARVLYESLGTSSDRALTVRLFEEPAHTPVHSFSLAARRVPKVLEIADLKPDTKYSVHFDEDDWVSFTTFPNPESGQKRELKMVVLSCDRYFEDKDDEMWALLNRRESDHAVDLIVHMGDQIYADTVLAQWRAQLANASDLSEEEAYEQLLENYRDVYRVTFGHTEAQKAMRHAANWMLLDDHDVFNNLDVYYLERDESVRAAFKAGMQAFYEYQGQLMQDMPEDTSASYRIDWVREVAGVAMVHLDLRHYRSYYADAAHPMTGDAQMAEFEKQISEYGARTDISQIFVFSSVPLMFLTPLMANIAYLAEQEIYPTHPKFINDTLELFDMMLPFHEKVRLVSGDIHQFVRGELCHSSGGCIPQLVSSGITKGSAVIDSLKLWLFYMAFRHIAPKGVGEWTIRTEQQVLLRNYGVVRVTGPSYEWHGVFPENISLKHTVLTFVFDNALLIILAQLVAFIIARSFKRSLSPQVRRKVD